MDYKRAFVDIDVLLNATITSLPLHEWCSERLRQLEAQGYELWISRQVMREYIVQVTRQGLLEQPLQPGELEHYVSTLENLFFIADETASVTANLVSLLKEVPIGGKQIHDANIIATMLVYDISLLVTTNDKDMRHFASHITLEVVQAQ